MLPTYIAKWMTTPELPSEARDRQHRSELRSVTPPATGISRRLVDLVRGWSGRPTRLEAAPNCAPTAAVC